MSCLQRDYLPEWQGLGQTMGDVTMHRKEGSGTKYYLNQRKKWSWSFGKGDKSFRLLQRNEASGHLHPILPIFCQCLPLAKPNRFRVMNLVELVHKFSLLEYASGWRRVETGSCRAN